MQGAIAKRFASAAWRIAALVLLSGQAAVALSQTPDTLIFGPKAYQRPGGQPVTVTDTFTVPSSVAAPFSLHIDNGIPVSSGSKRVTSANVKLNGVQILAPNDFGGGPATIDRTISLSGGSNTLVVTVSEPNSGVFTLSIKGTRIPTVPTTLTPNPLSITAGASGNLTATLSPTPVASGTLSVSSANTAVATVPAAVAFAAGQAQATIPVSAVAPGSAIVTATLNGGSASATINVTPAPPTITSLAPTSLTVVQGASGSLTVTISAAQTTDTTVAVASGNSAIASTPASVVVPAGQVSAPVPVSGVSPGSVQVTATLNGSSASSQVTVTPAPPTVVSLVPVTATVTLGASTNLTVTISAAQTTATVVAVAASPAGIVSVPASVTVPAGATTAVVPVSTLAFGQAGVTASLNNTSASSVVNVVPQPVQVTSIVPTSFTMNVGATSQFTVNINAVQPTATAIALSVDNQAVLQVPTSVTVAAGQTSAVFTATGLATGNAIITASANSTQATASVHVSPQAAAMVSLLPSPLPLQQGATGSLTATINVAQEVDTTITLADDAPAVAQAPESAIIPAGATSVALPVTAVAPGSANITASVNGSSATAAVTVTPPPPAVSSITPATLTLPKGTPGTLRVTVSRAPSAATAVTLSSNAPAIASVPPTVNIPAGALYADFPVASNDVGQAIITASLNGGSATATVTITPAELVTLTLSPQTPTVYIGDTEQFGATGTMTDGSSQDFTTRATWSSADPTIATINAAGLATPLAAGTTVISASYTFTAAATGQSVTISTSTQLTVKQPVALVLTAPTTTLLSGTSTTVTVTSSDPAPAGGLKVTLSATGTGTATFPSTVQIPEAGTSTTFTVTGNTGGAVTVTATAPQRLAGSITFSILQLAITSFAPTSGPVGTAVAINGIGFDPNLSNNQVAFNGEPAVIASGSATLLNVIVPPRAATGPITVTNALGTATSATPFTVQEREAFDIALAPATIQSAVGGTGATKVSLVSTGLNPYPYAATVTVGGLPAGVTVTLDRPSVFLNGDVVATFATQPTVSPGAYPVTISATGQGRLGQSTVSKVVTLTVLPTGTTTVTGRILHPEDASPFVGARARLGGMAVFTDATGTYQFVNPPVAGDQVVLLDGDTANTPDFEFPGAIAMPVMIVSGQDNKVLTSYIGRIDVTKFTAVTPGAAATVTNPDIPNFSLNIPAGATLFGFDGQPITKINVRTVPIDRLPIKPLPDGINTRTVYLYYFFREGGATPTTPIPVTMANDIDALPGEQVEMWYYDESLTPDPSSNQWRLMGLGTVTPDGKSVVSNPGVGMPKFCCGASALNRTSGGDDDGSDGGDGGNSGNSGGGPPPTDQCTDPDNPQSPNPVDLASGNAHVFKARSFGLTKVMPVNPNCRYRSTDTRIGLFGRGMTFTYDWFAEAVGADAVRVTNPQGVRYLLAREADGVFRSHTGRSKALEMEVTPTPTGRTLKLANHMQYEFDPRGRLLAAVDPNGNRTTLQLDSIGYPLSLTDATGSVYRFDRQGTPPVITRITDPQGRFIQFAYDAAKRLTSYTDQGGGVTLFEYGPTGQITKKTDPRGAVELIDYDAAGRAIKETLPGGGVQQFSYNVVGKTVTETRHTDENGNTTIYRWNNFGYVSQKTDALGRVTVYERDFATNLLRRKTDPAGRATQYTYNQRGDLIRVIDPAGNQTLLDYDLRFRKPVRIQNALGNVVTMTYDDSGNLITHTDAENETTTFAYTADGKLAAITDALNRTSRFAYDSNGNLIQATNAAGETSTRVYDAANRLIKKIDPLNRQTVYAYDGLDRLMQIQDAISGISRLGYDANDNRISVTDPLGNPIERNIYDLRNRLTQRTDAKNLFLTYVYDAVGNLIQMTDRKGQVTNYQYDALNRRTQVQDSDGRSTSYIYDLAGNLTRISDSGSGDLMMTYDELDRLSQIVSPQGVITYTYDAIGRKTSHTISGGDVARYTYDKANRVKTVSLRGRTSTYQYDAVGRLVQKVLPDGIVANYTYDLADRLLSISYTKADGTSIETIQYAYDAAGQRVLRASGSASVQESALSASYDETNRLTQITINGQSFTLAYDANGNLATRTSATGEVIRYTWNARNRLVQIDGPAVNATFKYDALNRRVERSVNGITTQYLYDGVQAIAELKNNAVDTVLHTGAGIDEVLARYGSAADRTLLTDALGSIVAQANDGQNIENFYAYSPYGEATTLGPDAANTLQFTGRESDGTGLYHYRARYYDPLLKRFISEDPVGIADSMNLYAYVRGNPASLTDPTGTEGKGNIIKELICGAINLKKRNDDYEREALIHEAQQIWQIKADQLADVHKAAIEACINEYQRTGDHCQLERCIDDAGQAFREGNRQNDAEFQSKMDQILNPSRLQQGTELGSNICDLFDIPDPPAP